ncbi:MAG: hypothetical protein HQL38_10870, partial [Alphaproteobacteria bacterium]|nr:hypothetical protein [Alphaproteobacteria bacterium]
VDARGKRRPTEVFVNTKSAEHFEWTTALTRMISALLRRGDDVSFVVEELMAVFSPMGGHWHKGEMVPSRPAAIGQILKQHMTEIGFFDEPAPEAKPVDGNVVSIAQAREAAGGQVRQCPKCGAAMARESGCDTCHHCGHSKCG